MNQIPNSTQYELIGCWVLRTLGVAPGAHRDAVGAAEEIAQRVRVGEATARRNLRERNVALAQEARDGVEPSAG